MFLKSETHCALLCSHFSSQKPIEHSSVLSSQLRNPLYTNTRLIYGYAQSTVAISLRLPLIYGCGQSTVMANLRLWPICGCGQSTVTTNLQLRSIYGCGHSILLLRPLCPLQLQFCYI